MSKIAKYIVRILKKKKMKLSIAESCTGGLASNMIVSISGASKIFELGLVTYSNKSKINILKVPKKIIKIHGSVSKQCCYLMAKNIKKKTNSDIALSVTGIAGPTGGTKKKPVGLVFIGIIFKKKFLIKKMLIKKKTRLLFQKTVAIEALNLIARFI